MADFSNEIFTVKARRCLRCGRLLTSEEAVENGYGCRCMELAKHEKREKEPIPGQMDIFDYLGGNDNGRSSDE